MLSRTPLILRAASPRIAAAATASGSGVSPLLAKPMPMATVTRSAAALLAEEARIIHSPLASRTPAPAAVAKSKGGGGGGAKAFVPPQPQSTNRQKKKGPSAKKQTQKKVIAVKRGRGLKRLGGSSQRSVGSEAKDTAKAHTSTSPKEKGHVEGKAAANNAQASSQKKDSLSATRKRKRGNGAKVPLTATAAAAALSTVGAAAASVNSPPRGRKGKALLPLAQITERLAKERARVGLPPIPPRPPLPPSPSVPLKSAVPVPRVDGIGGGITPISALLLAQRRSALSQRLRKGAAAGEGGTVASAERRGDVTAVGSAFTDVKVVVPPFPPLTASSSSSSTPPPPLPIASPTFQHKDGPIVFTYPMLVDLVGLINPERPYAAWRAVLYAIKSPLVQRMQGPAAVGHGGSRDCATSHNGHSAAAAPTVANPTGTAAGATTTDDEPLAVHEASIVGAFPQSLDALDAALYSLWLVYNRQPNAVLGPYMGGATQHDGSFAGGEAEAAEERRLTSVAAIKGYAIANNSSSANNNGGGNGGAVGAGGRGLMPTVNTPASIHRAWTSYSSLSPSRWGDMPSSPLLAVPSGRYTLRSLLAWAKADSPIRYSAFVARHGLDGVLGEHDITIPHTVTVSQRFLTEGEALDSAMEWLTHSTQKVLMVQSPYGTGKTTLLKQMFAQPMRITRPSLHRSPFGSSGGRFDDDDVATSTTTTTAANGSSSSSSTATNTANALIHHKPIKRILFVSYRITLSLNIQGNFEGFQVYLDLLKDASLNKAERMAHRKEQRRVQHAQNPLVAVCADEGVAYADDGTVDGDAFASSPSPPMWGCSEGGGGGAASADAAPETPQIRDVDKLICQIDSLHRVAGEHYDLVVLDEIEGILNHFSSKLMEDKRTELFNVMSGIIHNADRVIAMDGDIANRSKTFLLQLVSMRSIRLIANQITLRKLNYQFCSGTHYFEQQMDDALAAGKNIAIISMTLDRALKYQDRYSKEYSTVCYTSSMSQEAKRTLTNVNEEWTKHRVIIFSPSIEAGVDFNVPHVHKIFVTLHSSHDLYRCSTSQRGLSQMLARIRQFEDPNVLFLRGGLPMDGKTETRYTPAEVRLLYRDISSRVLDQYESENLQEILHYNRAEDLNKIYHLFIPIFLQRARDKGHSFEVIDDEAYTRKARSMRRARVRAEKEAQRQNMFLLPDGQLVPLADIESALAKSKEKERNGLAAADGGGSAATEATDEKDAAKGDTDAADGPVIDPAVLDAAGLHGGAAMTRAQREVLVCDISYLEGRGLWEIYWELSRRTKSAEMRKGAAPSSLAVTSAAVSASAQPTNAPQQQSGTDGVQAGLFVTRHPFPDVEAISGWDPLWEADNAAYDRKTAPPSASDGVAGDTTSPSTATSPSSSSLVSIVPARTADAPAVTRPSLTLLSESQLTKMHLNKKAHSMLFFLSFNDMEHVRGFYGRSEDFYACRRLVHAGGSYRRLHGERADLRWSELTQREVIVRALLDYCAEDWRDLFLKSQSVSIRKSEINWRQWGDVLYAERASLGLSNYRLSSDQGVLLALKALLGRYFISIRTERARRRTHLMRIGDGKEAGGTSAKKEDGVVIVEKVDSSDPFGNLGLSPSPAARKALRQRGGAAAWRGEKSTGGPMAVDECSDDSLLTLTLNHRVSRLLKFPQHVRMEKRIPSKFFN